MAIDEIGKSVLRATVLPVGPAQTGEPGSAAAPPLPPGSGGRRVSGNEHPVTDTANESGESGGDPGGPDGETIGDKSASHPGRVHPPTARQQRDFDTRDDTGTARQNEQGDKKTAHVTDRQQFSIAPVIVPVSVWSSNRTMGAARSGSLNAIGDILSVRHDRATNGCGPNGHCNPLDPLGCGGTLCGRDVDLV